MKLLAGPCVIENEECVSEIAMELKKISQELGFDFYFKASFDKANRSSIESYRGPGIDEGMKILKKIKDELDLKIVTDIHEPWQAEIVANVVDIIQIPAFLCRQTDLLTEAAKTQKIINIKKAQFLAPWDMQNVVKKICNINNNIMLTERGTCFGYNNLVVDMTSLVELRKLGYPVIFDATHSVQKPGGLGKVTGGKREYAKYLLYAATAVGIDGVFIETHPSPDTALSDGSNMIALSDVKRILQKVKKISNLEEEE